jgi:hypothetical protein
VSWRALSKPQAHRKVERLLRSLLNRKSNASEQKKEKKGEETPRRRRFIV